MSPDELLRSTLRDEWHLMPDGITALPRGRLSCRWEVAAGSDRFLVRLGEPAARQPVEAGVAVSAHLRAGGIQAGEPVRTLGGALTVETPYGTLTVLRRGPGRTLDGRDPVDQQFWGDRLGAVHRQLQSFQHPGLRHWNHLDAGAPHLGIEPWLRPAVAEAITATTRLTITDRLTYGVLHGDPAPETFVIDPATGSAGLLDCGAGGSGPLLYDVAAAVLYAGGEETSAELLDGYLAAGPLTEDELHAGLPVMLRFRWAVRADWAARRVQCAGAEGREVLRHARQALTGTGGGT
ncbi:phosphotransferase enzyme family protein [Actinoplanes sp. RD1]|uniref:phosphotransferase enzyme family protein n=1 Tax=Actinoplanes sp. RD1 TaxID=3064538 RepID=UPI0027416463|nr:phosphotransferase [Actinoplanes sp. RD1]